MRDVLHSITLTAGLLIAAALSGCETPTKDDSTASLRKAVEAGIERELQLVPEGEPFRPVTQPPSAVAAELGGRIGALDEIGPQRATIGKSLDLGPDLQGQVQQEVAISLQRAIATAVKNNLSARIAQLQPAISEADVVAAEAAFDATLFVSAGYVDTNQPQVVPIINNFRIGSSVQGSRSWVFETGVRRQLETGGSFSVSTDLRQTDNTSPGIEFSPDPAWNSAVRVGFSQPLLRGFGWDVNTATIQLTRNQERKSVQELRATLLDLLFQVESAYWELVVARQQLATDMWSVEVGEQVREVLARRRGFDTKQAQYSDAVATVEQRKSRVLASRRAVRAASDRLKTLMNDPEIPVELETLVAPVDWMVEAPINSNLREAVLSAVQNRPELQIALLGIDDASIRVTVADNQRLPALDLDAQFAFFGLNDSAGDAYSGTFRGNFVDYILGLTFSQPIGNRAAEADFRAARLSRSASVLNYRRALQDVVFDVKNALRNCATSYELISALRSTRLAEAENLRTLLVEEQTLASLTPEFLNLKFQRQDRLASASIAEYRAQATYNTSVAGLYRSLGIGLAVNRIEFEAPDASVASR
ncbi:MAG: TolC family protein [Phycisphaerales bacterium]|nr:TolC family protein [Phycisphaerales bacterium]